MTNAEILERIREYKRQWTTATTHYMILDILEELAKRTEHPRDDEAHRLVMGMCEAIELARNIEQTCDAKSIWVNRMIEYYNRHSKEQGR